MWPEKVHLCEFKGNETELPEPYNPPRPSTVSSSGQGPTSSCRKSDKLQGARAASGTLPRDTRVSYGRCRSGPELQSGTQPACAAGQLLLAALACERRMVFTFLND